MSVHVLLLGASGIPGRYILDSLVRLKTERHAELTVTVLKRPGSKSQPQDAQQYSVAQLSDFKDTIAFTELLISLKPTVVISALNAEPAPILDRCVVDAVVEYRSTTGTEVLFINGYTLDLLHPNVMKMPPDAIRHVQPKIDFANYLSDLNHKRDLVSCTIVNAAFLDYCLVKGYSHINLDKDTARLVDGGTATITGCSLPFVGDAVSLVVSMYAFGNESEKAQVVNKRLRIAETSYSGRSLLECVEKITGKTFEVTQERSEDILAVGSIIRYLNWSGIGASDFSSDGFEFGRESLKRKNLEELCRVAMDSTVHLCQ